MWLKLQLMMKIQPVIMCGGAGSRLWPMSRQATPKQFLSLVTERTMFQETALRVNAPGEGFLDPVIIAGRSHGAVVSEQLAAIGLTAAEIILEPCPRNTAPVAAVSSAWTARHAPDALILLMPADHHIADAAAFRKAVAAGARAAQDGRIVTFGIKADRPHTGYGYIEAGEKIADDVYAIRAFKEKPTEALAQEYLAQGGFYWNAGIFLFKADAMLAELTRHAPEICEKADAALCASVMSGAARRIDETLFGECPSDSIDYAVMEKTDRAAVVAPVDVGWTDIGSWSEVSANCEAEKTLQLGCKDVLIRTDGPFVAAADVENLIIVATGDAVLVARKDNAQEVRRVVEELKKRGREDLL